MLSGTILVFYVIVEINPIVVDMTLDTNLLTNACLYSYYWDYKLHIFLYPKSFNISYNIFYRFKPISLYGTNNIIYCMPFNIIHTFCLNLSSPTSCFATSNILLNKIPALVTPLSESSSNSITILF